MRKKTNRGARVNAENEVQCSSDSLEPGDHKHRQKAPTCVRVATAHCLLGEARVVWIAFKQGIGMNSFPGSMSFMEIAHNVYASCICFQGYKFKLWVGWCSCAKCMCRWCWMLTDVVVVVKFPWENICSCFVKRVVCTCDSLRFPGSSSATDAYKMNMENAARCTTMKCNSTETAVAHTCRLSMIVLRVESTMRIISSNRSIATKMKYILVVHSATPLH